MQLMKHAHPLQAAIAHVGLSRLAKELGVTHQAVRKWEAAGRMPRTEWTGETAYCAAIARLTAERPEGAVTREMLLVPWPQEAPDADQASDPPAGEQAGQGGQQLAAEAGNAA